MSRNSPRRSLYLLVLLKPTINRHLSESPVLADLLAWNSSCLRQLVQSRFRHLQIGREFVNCQHIRLFVGHFQTLCLVNLRQLISYSLLTVVVKYGRFLRILFGLRKSVGERLKDSATERQDFLRNRGDAALGSRGTW